MTLFNLEKYFRKQFIYSFTFLFLLQWGYSQENSKENIEFLSQDTFEELSKAYEDSADNTSLSKSYAAAFLLKAKRERDSLKQVEGYYLIAHNLTRTIAYNKALPYLDSAIILSKYNHTDIFPARAYILKANINGAQSNYSTAMDDLSIANTYAYKNKNVAQQYQIKYFISLLKTIIGEHKEAAELLKEIITYHENNNPTNDSIEYYHFFALYALGVEYNKSNKPDSALFTTKKAIRISLLQKDSLIYDRLLISAGHSFYLKKEYNRALDSIKKSQKILDYQENSIVVTAAVSVETEYLLGLIYNGLGQKERSISHIKKMDSIAFAEHYFTSGMKENYKLLIQYYKEQEDTQKQLYYIDRLIKADSITNYNIKNVSQKVNKDYDIPNLIREKKQIIDSLKTEKRNRRLLLIVLSSLSLILLFLFIWNYTKRRIYKKRFEELLNNGAFNNIPKVTTGLTNTKELDISKEIIEDVLKKLEVFENEQDFLKLNINLSSLAKEFNTNSKYFSKIINTYKGKSFTTYINDLRNEYVVQELKNNTKFRKYTIKAIANEIGFNTTEAFSKSFYKTTGIYPSYFITQLEKKS